MATQAEQVQVDGQSVRFTSSSKELYPETGTTKQDVLDYYLEIAPVFIPQACWRPATRKRWVKGVGTASHPEKSFFTKNLEKGAPAWIPTAQIEHKHGTNTYPLANNEAVLAWFAQMDALEIHVPQWRFSQELAEQRPDRLVIDLDPGPGVDLAGCARVALKVRDLVSQLGYDCYPVTSGSKGIHLYVPTDRGMTSEETTRVARQVAKDLEEEFPEQVVSQQSKELRDGKVLLDWSQNSAGKTTICPYSLRGRLKPTVAAPRTWEEIADPDLQQLLYHQVLARVADGINPLAKLGFSA